ncbi:MAG: IS3 family transposase, partial [Lachnospiraceae bacterium]|nr:IS3 family transposase [Lachnospiraceae bacterium]
KWKTFSEIQADIDDWMDYYNNDRYKVALCNLSPNEYYKYITTGELPVAMPKEAVKNLAPCP